MPLNTELVGKVYPAYRYEVSREKIREYATALGESDPRYTSDGDACVAPPTFAACFTVIKGGMPVIGDPDLGAHFSLVHGSQKFAFGAPLKPGDVLTCTPSITSISARGANEFLGIRVEARHEASGDLAVTADETIVFLGSAPAPGDGSAPAPADGSAPAPDGASS